MDKPMQESITEPYAKFTEMIGQRLIQCENGVCTIELDVAERHRQKMGYVHGGIIAALIDHTGGSAAMSLCPDGFYLVTSDINVSYLRPALPPTIRFTGTVIKSGKAASVVSVDVWSLHPTEKRCAVGRLTLLKVTRDGSPVAG